MKTAQREAEMLVKVQEYVHALFGNLPIRRLLRGTNHCYVLGNPPQYVVKTQSDDPQAQYEAVQFYQKAGIPVAPIVHCNLQPPGFKKAILVMKYIDHDPDASLDEQEMGSVLRRMHEIHLSGSGKLKEGRGRNKSWQEFLQEYVGHWTAEYQLIGVDPERYLAGTHELPTLQTLVHGDFTRNNILVKENRIVAVIDPNGIVGDPMFDLAICTYDPERKDMADVLRGYAPEGLTPDEVMRLNKYHQLIRLQKAGWITKVLAKEELPEKRREWFENRRKNCLESLTRG